MSRKNGGGERQITEYADPGETFTSQYGTVTYREWCEKELARINAGGSKAMIGTDKDGNIALVRCHEAETDTAKEPVAKAA